MTVIYNLEVTAQFDDKYDMYEKADRCIMSPELKQKWERKVEKETEKVIPTCNVVCTNIQVFGGN